MAVGNLLQSVAVAPGQAGRCTYLTAHCKGLATTSSSSACVEANDDDHSKAQFTHDRVEMAY
jgi:hypothetical protein